MNKLKIKQTFIFLIILSLLALAGYSKSGTDKSKDLELTEKSSTEGNSNKAGNTKKTEPVKTNDSAGIKGCAPVTAVSFSKGTSSKTYRCEMNAKSYRHKYTLYAKAGQMFDIQFETEGAGPAPQAVYKITNPNGVVKTRDEGENSGLQLDKTGKWAVTVDLNSTATRPYAKYTITFTIGTNDD